MQVICEAAVAIVLWLMSIAAVAFCGWFWFVLEGPITTGADGLAAIFSLAFAAAGVTWILCRLTSNGRW